MKKVLKISIWVLTVIAIGCLWFFTNKAHVDNPLASVEMTIERKYDTGFINKTKVYQDLLSICDTANNTRVSMIPIDSIKQYLQSIPWATETYATITLDEVLVTKIVECQPVMRVYNKEGKSVYLDNEGRIFPVNSDYKIHLMIASGVIRFPVVEGKSANINDDDYKFTDLPKVFNVMQSVQKNPYTNCCVKQVYFDGRQYELVMNNVDARVVLGDDENIDAKLENLQYFFEKMQGAPELSTYKQISFNFDNQVVCTKNKNKK